MILYDLLKNSDKINSDIYEFIELLNNLCIEYGLNPLSNTPFPFNYVVREGALIYNKNIIKLLGYMNVIGMDLNKLYLSKEAELYINHNWDIVNESLINKFKQIQAIVRMCYRLQCQLNGNTIEPVTGDTKSIKLSSYLQAIFDMIGVKIDVGTFIEKLHLLKEKSAEYKYVLYDYKDIPQGYNDCLHKSCMNNSNSTVRESVNFYTWFKGIRLLCIEQDNKIVSRAILWQLPNKNWLCDRIYSYNGCVDMYSDIESKLGEEFKVNKYGTNQTELILIEDMRTGKDEAGFYGFLKQRDKIYVSVQEIDKPCEYDTTPFFDSVRTIKIHKQYCNKISFIFNKDNLKRYSNSVIRVRESSNAFADRWCIRLSVKYIYDINEVVRINGDAFSIKNINLTINHNRQITSTSNSDSCVKLASNSIYASKLTKRYMHNVVATDFYNNPIDILGLPIKWYAVDNIIMYVNEEGYYLVEDTVLSINDDGDQYELQNGVMFRASVNIKQGNTCIISPNLYKCRGYVRDTNISAIEEDTVLYADTKERILRSDSIEINGKYYLKDLSLRGICND